MILSDIGLARRIEAAEVRFAFDSAAIHKKLFPGRSAVVEEAAGGCMAFLDAAPLLTHAIGLGMDGPVADADIGRVETFFRTRGMATEIVLCPLAHESLVGLLGARGYRIKEMENVLVRPLPAPDAAAPQGVVVRRAAPADAAVAARTVVSAFQEGEEPETNALEMFSLLFHMPSAPCFLGYVDGQPAAGGMVRVCDGVAALYGAATLPQFRHRGLQTALLQARLACAAAAGCDLALVSTRPGSTSQRNVERQGFRVAYTRVVMWRE